MLKKDWGEFFIDHLVTLSAKHDKGRKKREQKRASKRATVNDPVVVGKVTKILYGL
jgi:hypothetical protein